MTAVVPSGRGATGVVRILGDWVRVVRIDVPMEGKYDGWYTFLESKLVKQAKKGTRLTTTEVREKFTICLIWYSIPLVSYRIS